MSSFQRIYANAIYIMLKKTQMIIIQIFSLIIYY